MSNVSPGPAYGRLASALAAAILAFAAPAAAQVSINGGGGATTEISIEVPRYHQLAPSVHLGYQSSAGPGLAGAGWNLAAASQLTRTSATGGISALEPTDRFWLDGAELVPCAAGSTSPSCTTAIVATGSSAGYYSTQIESFRRIHREPQGFTVWEPNGTRSEFTTVDGGASYQLRTVTDTFGNRLDYAWTCNQGCELDAIRYGGTPAGAGAEILFYREDRPDPWLERTAAGQVFHGQRLRTVAVRNDGHLVRAYRLTYGESRETRASILTSVQQFGTDATVDASGIITAGPTPPLPARTFDAPSLAASGAWSLGAETSSPSLLDVSAPLTTPLAPRYPGTGGDLASNFQYDPDGGSGDPVPSSNGYLTGDFDGDGRAEVVTWALRDACTHVSFRTHRTDGSGTLPAPITSLDLSTGTTATCKSGTTPTRAYAGDFNGDGVDDVLLVIGTELRRYDGRVSGRFVLGPATTWDSGTGGCAIGDTDGDGRDDLVCEQPATRRVVVRRATPTGWLTSQVATNGTGAPALPDHTNLTLAIGDVDGDGLADILLARAQKLATRVLIGRATGTGSFDWSEEQTLPLTGTLATADLDGDGHLDLVWSREVGLTTELDVALARKGYSTTRWRQVARQTSPLTQLHFADVDGDGHADLIGRSFTPVGEDLRIQRVTGDGTLGTAEASLASCQTPTGFSEMVPADWNGDGLTDPSCIELIDDGTYRVIERPAQPRGTDRHRWQRADLDGDGRMELIYVAFRNPGYVVHVVSPQTGQHVAFTVNATNGGRLREPDASRWIVADLGSPSGPADGKDDLALVEVVSGRLIVTTLLSTGLGTFSILQQDAGAVGAGSQGWFAWTDDRDGRAALMRTVTSVSNLLRIETLRPTGPGQFALSAASYFGAGSISPLTDKSVRGFKPADLDGDGLTDLIQVDAVPGAPIVVRSLRADGNGGFTSAAATLPSLSLIGPRAVRAADLDGDGAADLYHVTRTLGSAPCLVITHFAGDGRGGFAPGGYGGTACLATTDPLYRRLFEDSSSIIALDLDRDGRGELLHVTHALDGAGSQRLIVTRLRRDLTGSLPTWRVTTLQQPLAYDLGDSWSWTAYRDPVSGDAGISYIHPQVSLVLRWQRVRDELTSVENGTGLVTSIAYGPLVGGRSYLPAGYTPRVVTQITTTDEGETPATTETVQYGYLGATWSDARSGLLGFATTTANDGRVVRFARYAVGAACGAQLVQQELRDPSGATWSYSTTSYVAAGAAPFHCMVATTASLECERLASCRTAVATSASYDDYGNATSNVVVPDHAPPTISVTPVTAAAFPYVIDRPSSRTVYGLEGGAWRLESQQVFGYDHQPSTAAPITGALTSSGSYDDQAGKLYTTELDYDAVGNLTSQRSPEGRTTRTTFDPTYQQYPISVCDALHCQDQTWDLVLGAPSSSTDANQAVTTTSYDAHGRPARIDRPDGGFTITRYLDLGATSGPFASRQRVRTEVRDGSPGDDVLWTEAWFDGSGRTYRSTREGGATTTTTFADGSARPAATSNVHDAASLPDLWTTFEYDGPGRLVTARLPDGQLRLTQFDLGSTTQTDELGASHTSALDGLGHAYQITDPAGSVTTYQYDALGRVLVIADALGNQDLQTWNSRGLQIASSDPDRGARSYTYTPDGKLDSVTDGLGQVRSLTYDDLGRMAQRVDHDSGGASVRTVEFTYDDGQDPHGASTGRLIRTDDLQPTTKISDERWYDGSGRVEQSRRCIDGTCMSEGFQFDLAGRVAQLEYPDAGGKLGSGRGEFVDQRYDDAGRLIRVGGYARLGHELDDQLQTLALGNGVETRFGYTPERRWLETLTIDGPAGGVATIKYARDPVGRIVYQIADGALQADLTYSYDVLGRLTRVDSPDVLRQEQMAYDAIGRIRWLPEFGDFRYDDPSHAHAMTTTDRGGKRGYDGNGNVVDLVDPSGRELSMAWTVDDRLATVRDQRTGARHEFAYDLEGHRVKKTDSAGVTRYFSPRLELDPQGGLVKSYLAGDRLVARDVGGTVSYLTMDGGRNVRLVTDASGNVVEHDEYRAFGALQQTMTSGPPGDIAFAGERVEADLGLVVMGARTYDPGIGQFLSADSVIPSLARPQSLHRYSYVENDPINYRDPSGHMRLLIELRKLRIEETPGLPSIEEALSRIYDLGWAWTDRGMTMDQALKVQLGYYAAAHPPHSQTSSDHEAAVRPPGVGTEVLITRTQVAAEMVQCPAGMENVIAFDETVAYFRGFASDLLDEVLALPHDFFLLGGGEGEAKFSLFRLHVGGNLEAMTLLGHSSDEGAYVEGVAGAGYALEGKVSGLAAYGGMYGLQSIPVWSSKGEVSPRQGISVEGGLGIAYAGAYDYGQHTQGFYMGAKFGSWFVGGGMSYESVFFPKLATDYAMVRTATFVWDTYQRWTGRK